MVLKLDPVRLLIADDVGIGKTIESGLVVRGARAGIRFIFYLCSSSIISKFLTLVANCKTLSINEGNPYRYL